MLEAKNVCYEIEQEEEPLLLLNGVDFCIPEGHFMAIVGPSGCGKTTLLKTIAGIITETDGHFCWNGRNLAEDGDFEPDEIGYVPQFSIAYDQLTVDESIESAARLRCRFDSEDELDDIIDKALDETGLSEIADRQVKHLSGGQKRRLALAMELVSSPRILLCDEVTSGLDPRSEKEIMTLLHDLARKDGRIVISVTHSLADMDMYDSIMVLHQGCIAYHGSPRTIGHYFSTGNLEEIYPKLALRKPADWKQSWIKHRESYYERLDTEREHKLRETGTPAPAAKRSAAVITDENDEELPGKPSQPGAFSQFWTLFARRWKILSRDRTQLMLQIAMILIFPIMVSLFSSKGQEQIIQFTAERSQNLTTEIQQAQDVQENRAKVGSAVSGIIMFEVILLGLMGSNNAAREIAGERLIVEKEKFAGVGTGAYMMSKYAFLGILVLVQSLWMFAFVEWWWPYRGDSMTHLGFLILANAAMTSVCLGISALSRTPDQASLLSIYLVGFQLPLSGAVLALPNILEPIVHPFISAYWAWSGSIEGGLAENIKQAVRAIVNTEFSAADLCFYILIAHIIAGMVLTYIGLKRDKWD